MAREVAPPRKKSVSFFEPAFAQMERKSRSQSFLEGSMGDIAQNAGQPPATPDEEDFGGETSTLASGMNLVTTMVGAGVLAFPGLFAKGGWGLSICILIASCFSVTEIGVIIDKSLSWCEKRGQKYPTEYTFGTRPQKYEDMMEVAFGMQGKTLTFWFFNIFLLMLSGAYMILIGTSMEYILRQDWAPYRVCVLLMSLFFGPMTLLDNMSVISRLSGIGVVASIMYVICIAWAGFSQDYKGSYEPQIDNPLATVGTLISVMLMGFTYQIVVPTVRSEMAEPSEMPKAIYGAVTIVTGIYLLAGSAGFLGYGLEAAKAGNVLKNMITEDKQPIVPGTLLSLSIVANLCVTIPILMNCVCRAVESRMGGYNIPVRLGLFLTALCVGFFCPFFLEFFSIIASLLCVPICILCPLAVYWKLQGGDNDEPVNQSAKKCRLVKHSIILIMAAITVFVGSYGAFKDLFDAMQKETKGFWAHS